MNIIIPVAANFKIFTSHIYDDSELNATLCSKPALSSICVIDIAVYAFLSFYLSNSIILDNLFLLITQSFQEQIYN